MSRDWSSSAIFSQARKVLQGTKNQPKEIEFDLLYLSELRKRTFRVILARYFYTFKKMQSFNINPALLNKLKSVGSIKNLPADSVLMNEDDYIQSIPIVLSGSIKVMRTDEDGREILLYYIKPGESCVMSFLGATCNERSKIKAVVEDAAEILMLPIHKATEFIRTYPEWLEFIFQLYNQRFEELLEVVNAIAFQKVDERLWELIKKKVEMNQTRELSITHQQLADELGTAREVVSRLLKQLEKGNKILLARNKIKVLSAV
ncbi:MAG: Crp/Fnr family transcriptional regulator [Flammeovirgaceae bacterium]|nr:Crp/Fnr family transcriptional regulator [Flammeovirgaceae bacterium]